MLTGLNKQVFPETENLYRELVKKRKEHYPLQYLTGIQNFMSLDFEVNEKVLIPRWDTEILVEQALEMLKKLDAPRVIDVGTGSGAIGVSLAKYHRGSRVLPWTFPWRPWKWQNETLSATGWREGWFFSPEIF